MSVEERIEVFSILGNEYSVKAPPGEQQALLQAFGMLERTLAETKRKYPTLVGDRLLVLTALNLCQNQLSTQTRIDALVAAASAASDTAR